MADKENARFNVGATTRRASIKTEISMTEKTRPSKPSYAAKLRDPRWQRKRLSAMAAAEFRCEMCQDDASTLHVHHKQYIKGREPWEYDDNQLAVLCESCHENVHSSAPDLLADIVSRLDFDGPSSRDTVAYLVAGFLGMAPEIRFHGDKVLVDVGAKARDAYWSDLHDAVERMRTKA